MPNDGVVSQSLRFDEHVFQTASRAEIFETRRAPFLKRFKCIEAKLAWFHLTNGLPDHECQHSAFGATGAELMALGNPK
jgi:hypothetical protein